MLQIILRREKKSNFSATYKRVIRESKVQRIIKVWDRVREREIFGNREILNRGKSEMKERFLGIERYSRMREIAGINYCGIKKNVNKCQGIIYKNIILSIKGVNQFV